MKYRYAILVSLLTSCLGLGIAPNTSGAEDVAGIVAQPGLYKSLTEPPCSYISTQHRKGLVNDNDPVVAWIRGAHNGGAIPLRHFLAAPRVINDTYGLFFFDSDGGYVSAFKKDYGYEFYGWRKGVMMARGPDGTIWSCLTGLGIQGPQQGRRLERVPSLLTQWGHWRMLHPESTAYDLFDGHKYPRAELPWVMSAQANQSIGAVDPRLDRMTPVLGVESAKTRKAFPLDPQVERACFMDQLDGEGVAVFWYGPTSSAVAFATRLEDRALTFYADDISPETAPFKDHETGTRWTLAGRGVDGPLKGMELTWIPSIQCRWYAWTAEYPETEVYSKTGSGASAAPVAPVIQGILLDPGQAIEAELKRARSRQANVVALYLDEARLPAMALAAERIRSGGFALYYWIEIARNPKLADEHPEWMASLQGHPEWRRYFPAFPNPGPGEVVKVYPWVPVLYRETSEAHLDRVRSLLESVPKPAGIFLNDLQGAPSACGCGHSLCRWTTDYGPIATATRLPSDAAARFIASVKAIAPGVEIVPVWTTECEEGDKDQYCAGVGCYRGACWKEFSAQLEPVARESPRLGALLPYKMFQRDLPRYGAIAGWIKEAIDLFGVMPVNHGAPGVASDRIIAVLQG